MGGGGRLKVKKTKGKTSGYEAVMKAKRAKYAPKKKASGERWSRAYDQCQKCGTTETKYSAKGLCKNCYQNEFNKKKKTGTEPKPKKEVLIKYECLDCAHQFKSEPIDNMVGGCPKCGGNVIQK
jgi:Zn finger protein HypA/HybF involved in hydrogenase expression